MSTRIAFTFLAIAVAGGLLAAEPADAASIFWANPVSGDWSNPANWNPQQVPGPDDIAFINLSGTYTVTMDIDADVSRFAVGASTGTQTLLMDSRTMLLHSGVASTVVQGGVVQIQNGSSITGTSSMNNLADVILDGSTIDVNFSNQGSLDVGGTNSIGGTLSTNSNSVIRIGENASLTVANGFNNNNMILLSAGGGALNVTAGTLTNRPAATIIVSGSGAARTLGAELNNQGTLSVNANLALGRDSAAQANSGSINCLGGSLAVNQAGTDPTFTNTGSIRVNSPRSIAVTGGTFENAVAGSITGTGTLDVSGTSFGNSGGISPGVSPGILTVTGDLTQTSDGTLNIEIGGLNAGTEYDRLDVSGAVSLDGTLNVSLINGFFPHDGDTFEILTYASYSGAFADTSSLEVGGGIKLIQNYGPNSLTLVAVMPPDVVQPIHPGTCITPLDPCLTIPFRFERMNPLDVRAFSVTFAITSELQLCDGLNSIVEGSFLSGYCGGGCTAFHVHDNEDGSFTVDATILGGNCGPDSSGTLFTVDLTHTGSDGVGTVSVLGVTVRDCDNFGLPGTPGEPIDIGIDVEYPLEIADLTATQVKSGNDDDGTTAIRITFSGDVSNDLLEVFRKGYGDYPEYDDGTGEVPTAPATPDQAIANGWTLTDVTESGQTDEPPTRDYWYYIAFVTSLCDLQTVSNMTGGTLNYHLGDVSDGVTTCNGDNLVGTIDVSFLGAHYFKTGAEVDSVNCLDFGPTDDFSTDGLPTTDNAINFEDLVLIGINFGEVGALKQVDSVPGITSSTDDALNLVLAVDGTPVRPHSTLTARLVLKGNEAIVKGIHSVVTYDRSRLRLIDVAGGGLLEEQTGTVFFKHRDAEGGITIDAVILGRDRTFQGSGEVAVLRFQSLGSQVRPSLAVADLRDLENRHLLGQGTDPVRQHRLTERPVQTAEIPTVTRLLGARPNPFAGRTEILFTLSEEAEVALRIYDVGGRLVRTLANGVFPAGAYGFVWDGANDAGQPVSAGIYLATFRTGGVEETHKLILNR